MNNKSLLMPHVCQKIGWWLFLVSILVDVVKTIFFHVFDSMEVAGWMARSSSILMLASLPLICLSKEKVEDEMISSLRLRAVGITAYVFFLFFLINSLFSVVSDLLLPHFEPNLYIYELILLCLPVLTAGLYYLLFKWMLWRSRKQNAL